MMHFKEIRFAKRLRVKDHPKKAQFPMHIGRGEKKPKSDTFPALTDTKVRAYSSVLNGHIWCLFASQEWASGQKMLTFQPTTHSPPGLPWKWVKWAQMAKQKGRKQIVLRHLTPQNLIIDATVTFCFPSHLKVLLGCSVFLTVSCCFRCGSPLLSLEIS